MITIFTPTYNRKKEIKKLYESLLNQTSKGFEWLIVDDGSTDKTKEFFLLLEKQQLPFKIRYIYQENSGKHVAYNTAIKNMKTEWHVVVDSDDILFEKSIEIFEMRIQEIENDMIGLIFPRKNLDSIYISPWIEKKIPMNIPDIKFKFGLNIETCIVINNKYIKKFQFPKFKDEKFMSEESLYYYLADYGKFLPFKDQVYGYRYLEDGWTKNLFRIWEENPLSTLYSLKMRKKYIQKHVKGLKKTKELIKVSMNINSLEWLNEKSFKKYIKGKSIKQWFYVPIFFMFKKIRFERKK